MNVHKSTFSLLGKVRPQSAVMATLILMARITTRFFSGLWRIKLVLCFWTTCWGWQFFISRWFRVGCKSRNQSFAHCLRVGALSSSMFMSWYMQTFLQRAFYLYWITRFYCGVPTPPYPNNHEQPWNLWPPSKIYSLSYSCNRSG